MAIQHRDVTEWLDAWQRCIQTRDLDAASPLFAEDVMSFGTRAATMQGLEALREEQWRPTWERTRDFRFDPATLRVWWEGDLVVMAVCWESVARDAQATRRQGRCTIVLRRHHTGQLVACHTHFSIRPVVEACLK